MKNTVILIVVMIFCIITTACGSLASSSATDSIKTLTISGKFEPAKDFAEMYDYADYLVICKVVSKGESFLRSGELDTTLPENELMDMLVGMRTPYEIKVLESYKGDLEIGDTYTVVTLEGQIGNYVLDSGLPDLEIGKVYFMPICISDPTESIPYFPALAEVLINNNSISLNSVNGYSSYELKPLMFEKAYQDITNVADAESMVANKK